MKKATLIVRILLGVMLIVFGSNKFLQFMPMGAPAPEMGAWFGAIMATGFLFPLIAIVEIGTGILFLVNKYVALAAVLLFPVMLNAFLAHLFLDPAGIGGATLVVGLNIFMFFANKEKYAALLKA